MQLKSVEDPKMTKITNITNQTFVFSLNLITPDKMLLNFILAIFSR